jgi:hypothetical protein
VDRFLFFFLEDDFWECREVFRRFVFKIFGISLGTLGGKLCI